MLYSNGCPIPRGEVIRGVIGSEELSSMSTVLPREPHEGDLFLGEVTAFCTHPCGLVISAPEFPLYMPIELLDETHASQPTELIGKWVECQVVRVVVEKRAIAVRPIAWLDSEQDTTECYNRVREYWMTQRRVSKTET